MDKQFDYLETKECYFEFNNELSSDNYNIVKQEMAIMKGKGYVLTPIMSDYEMTIKMVWVKFVKL